MKTIAEAILELDGTGSGSGSGGAGGSVMIVTETPVEGQTNTYILSATFEELVNAYNNGMSIEVHSTSTTGNETHYNVYHLSSLIAIPNDSEYRANFGNSAEYISPNSTSNMERTIFG